MYSITNIYTSKNSGKPLDEEPPERLDKDRSFLKKGGVFSDDFIDSYIELKMGEVYNFEHTPHPVEFKMYYSV
ncbi:MAG TPA: hypothetical protein VII56_00495 [Rhizomicrobium sp.]